MRHEELIRFAKNESQNLTPESFRVLLSELEDRNLDIGILEEAETETARRPNQNNPMSTIVSLCYEKACHFH